MHRPRYGDWSWPKGKLDPGETALVAAVREVAEETGLEVALGIPLPTARYRLSDSLEQVRPLLGGARTRRPAPAPTRPLEVDETAWVGVEEATTRLTRRGDRAQLAPSTAAHAEGALDTFPVVVCATDTRGRSRRGDGRTPSVRWSTSASRRPHGSPTCCRRGSPVVLCSPWKRCVQTVEPFLASSPASCARRSGSPRTVTAGTPRTARLVTDQLRKGREQS